MPFNVEFEEPVTELDTGIIATKALKDRWILLPLDDFVW